MAFLAPLFLAALAAIAVPIWVHMIQRERRDLIEFPSLMFIRRIPYESVERRRIHNWWLLALRVAALGLIVLAFARRGITRRISAQRARVGAALRPIGVEADSGSGSRRGDSRADRAGPTRATARVRTPRLSAGSSRGRA